MPWTNILLSMWLSWFNTLAIEGRNDEWSARHTLNLENVSKELRVKPPGTGRIHMSLRIDQWKCLKDVPGICLLKAQGYPIDIEWAREPYTNLPCYSFSPPQGKLVKVMSSGRASYTSVKSYLDKFRDAIVCPHCDQVIFMDYYDEYRKDFWSKK